MSTDFIQKTPFFCSNSHIGLFENVAQSSCSAILLLRIIFSAQYRGNYNSIQAAKDYERCILGTKNDNFKELSYTDKKAIHNLKYFTWVEQQQKDIEDLNTLWKDRNIWDNIFNQVDKWDELIDEFNKETGVLRSL